MGFSVREMFTSLLRRSSITRQSIQSRTTLRLTELERRELPALFGVRLVGSGEGLLGDTAATHTGSLSMTASLPSVNGWAVVDAADEVAAAKSALTGTITVTFSGATASYSASAATIGTSAGQQLPFLLTANPSGVMTLALEDAAALPNITCDWDYNDRTWAVQVQQTNGVAPSAQGESLTVAHDRPLLIDPQTLLANDSTTGSVPLSVMILSQPTHGEIDGQLAGDWQQPSSTPFQYLPINGYTGSDSFTYLVTDGVYTSSPVTATLTVENHVPVAVADTYVTGQDVRLVAGGVSPPPVGNPPLVPPGGGGVPDLFANDTDSDSDILRATLVSDVSNGLLTLNSDGSFVYTPNANFYGVDTFTYKAEDSLSESAPVTVTIIVQQSRELDLDGMDSTTGGQWMREADEQAYGLGVGDGETATILARGPLAPDTSPGWQLLWRKVQWSSSTLTVGGDAVNSEMTLPTTTSDVSLSVSMKAGAVPGADGVVGAITYQAAWQNTITGMGRVSLVSMKAGEKAELDTIKFTSDHDVLLDETKDPVSNKGKRYDAVEYKRDSEYNAPISHTMDQKVKLDLTFTRGGVAQGTDYKIVGTSTSDGLQFDTEFTAGNSNSVVVSLESTKKLPRQVTSFPGEIEWSMVLNPNDPDKKVVLPMGKTKHTVYVTYDKPRIPTVPPPPPGVPAPPSDQFKPTVARMKIVTDVVGKGYEKAKDAVKNNTVKEPNTVRIAFQTLKLHVFNPNNEITGDNNPLKTPEYAWLVPKYWTEDYPGSHATGDSSKKGGDCISGATFTMFALYLAGIPGDINATGISATVAKPTKATIWTAADRTRKSALAVPVDDEWLVHIDRNDIMNLFEAVVVITPTGSTKSYFIPSGVTPPLVYTNPDDVLSVFKEFGWYKKKLNKDGKPQVIDKPLATYDDYKPAVQFDD